MIQTYFELLKQGKGFTLSFATGVEFCPDHGYAHAIVGNELQVKLDSLTLNQLSEIFRNFAEKGELVGGWVKDGVIYFDSVNYSTCKASVEAYCEKHGELAYYCFSTKQVIWL